MQKQQQQRYTSHSPSHLQDSSNNFTSSSSTTTSSSSSSSSNNNNSMTNSSSPFIHINPNNYNDESPNLFKKDYGKAIKTLHHQTNNHYIQQTVMSHLQTIKNKSSDRAFLEGVELGMQINGFLTKLNNDSKNYISELLQNISLQINNNNTNTTTNVNNVNSVSNTGKQVSFEQPPTTTNGYSFNNNQQQFVDQMVRQAVHEMLEKAKQSAIENNQFSSSFVNNCMQKAMERYDDGDH
ncbi:hypothetical protein ABK040_003326 [Willaertia magna]